MSNSFDIYVGDNYLNSYLAIFPISVESQLHHKNVMKVDVEQKLPKPYNDCDSYELLGETYRRQNCI